MLSVWEHEQYCLVVQLNGVFKKKNILERCEVNLHKQGAENERGDVKLDLRTQRNHYRKPYPTSKDCQGGGADEDTSEDNSMLPHGDSYRHSLVTKKHHLDRVKTSEVTIAISPCVCVHVSFSVYAMLQSCHIISLPWHN